MDEFITQIHKQINISQFVTGDRYCERGRQSLGITYTANKFFWGS